MYMPAYLLWGVFPTTLGGVFQTTPENLYAGYFLRAEVRWLYNFLLTGMHRRLFHPAKGIDASDTLCVGNLHRCWTRRTQMSATAAQKVSGPGPMNLHVEQLALLSNK